MRTKCTKDPVINAGNLVQVFIQNGKEKCGKWSSPHSVISVDNDSGIVTVPGSRGHKIRAAIEDTRVAIQDDDLASSVQESIDQLDDSASEAISKYINSSANQDSSVVDNPSTKLQIRSSMVSTILLHNLVLSLSSILTL